MSLIADTVIKIELDQTSDKVCNGFDIDIKSDKVIEEENIEHDNKALEYNDEDIDCNNVVIKFEDNIKVEPNQVGIAHIFTDTNKTAELFQCSKCNFTTYFKNGLNSHSKTHGNPEELNCKFCEKGFYQKRTLDNHMLKSHPNEKHEITSKLHSCELCTFETTVKKEIRRHMFQQHSQVINATHCTVDDITQLNCTSDVVHNEISTKIENVEEIKIEYDDLEYKNVGKEKQQEMPVKKKRHVCDYCDYQTHFRRAIKEHMSIHNKDTAEQFKCHKCNFTTYYKMSLQSHIKRHGEREKLNCTFCKKGFYYKKVLHNHLLKCHPNEKYEITSKLHSCKLCTFKTTVKKEITRHLRKHSQHIHPKHCVTLAYDCSCHKSVKKQFYKCLQCEYRSDRVSEFQIHLRTHST